jgi:hypothetical protein
MDLSKSGLGLFTRCVRVSHVRTLITSTLHKNQSKTDFYSYKSGVFVWCQLPKAAFSLVDASHWHAGSKQGMALFMWV